MAGPQAGWEEGFELAVLHSAAFGTLLRDVPGVFSAEWFGDLQGAQGRAPRVRLAKMIEEFYRQEQSIPGAVVMEELLRRSARSTPPLEYKLLQDEWARVAEQQVSSPQWVADQVRQWARLQAYTRAVYGAAEVIDNKDPQFDVKVETLFEKARLVGSREEEPIGLLATSAERVKLWEKGVDRTNKIPTGLGPLDEALDGGVERGEQFYFLAPPKGGKSAFLMNVAINAARHRFNALLCSFEMPRSAMARRADRRLALATSAELYRAPELLTKAVAGYRASGSGEVYLWAGVAAKNGIRDAEACMLNLQKRGIPIDLVVMDYLNFMVPARAREEEMRHRLNAVSLEMSAFVRKYNVAGWSATLVNRAAVSKKVITKKDIAEAFSVVAVANGMVAICAPKVLVDNGMRSLYLAAVRESEDEKMVGLYRFDGAKMRVGATNEPWPEDEEDEGTSQRAG